MTAARYDFIVEKGQKFYQEVQLTYDNGLPRSLVGRKVACKIKESLATDTVLFSLTELNGGIVVVNDSTAVIGMYISADDTNVDVDYGVYTLVEINETYPDTETTRLLEGVLEFRKGTL